MQKPGDFSGQFHVWAMAVVAAWCLVGAAAAQDAEESQAPRWTEMGYGISLTPPAETIQYEGPRVVWDDPRGFALSFEIVRSDIPSTVENFAASAIVQASFALNTPRLVNEDGEQASSFQRIEQIAERPATRLYFEIDPRDAEHEPLIQGQVIVMLEPYAAAVLTFKAPLDRAEEAKNRFNAVLQTLHVPLAEEVNTIRETRVEAAEAWLAAVGREGLQDALPELAWFRVTFKGKDIGHLRLASSRDPETLKRQGHSQPGTLLHISRRHIINGQSIDTRTLIFVSADGKQEEWDTRTSLRNTEPERAGLNRAALPALATWAETGVRGDRQINGQTVHALTVITDRPPRGQTRVLVKENQQFVPRFRDNDQSKSTQIDEWQAPERAYLSQADLWSYAGLLPREAAEYCFTAYYPGSKKPGLRLVQVLPQPGGGLVVRERPTSQLSPIEHVYDADGQLVRRVYPDGLTLLKTSPQELAKLWDIERD